MSADRRDPARIGGSVPRTGCPAYTESAVRSPQSGASWFPPVAMDREQQRLRLLEVRRILECEQDRLPCGRGIARLTIRERELIERFRTVHRRQRDDRSPLTNDLLLVARQAEELR